MKRSPTGGADKSPGIIKLIGIGQSLRGDDAAGLAAVRLWQEKYQSSAALPNLQVELAELPGVGLLNLLEGSRLAILVDAVHSDAKAGTIHLLQDDQLESLPPGTVSAHGWGVAETLSLGKQLMASMMPQELILIGIEAGQLSLGESLSPEVERALPEVARLIERTISSE